MAIVMRSILVALDSSAQAASVLAAAAHVAKREDAKLTLYRAVEIPVDFPMKALAATDVRRSRRLRTTPSAH